ncbi:MAG: N-acetyl-gamma-glutamyl-phosphate reductase [Eubacteriales bacterium]|nr:N-acetyl-gamma-glutamyl-phosphate reductase [Eubacteriales bacterium]
MAKVFIDGSAGTTGLRIHERLAGREDIELLILPDEVRKDAGARAEALNQSDIAFLCLPDAAAVEAVSLLTNPHTALIDTSTAHRTHPDWAYGFPEIGSLREKIASSKRIGNPGCHASGFIALVQPLISAGLLAADTALTCFSLTGYSGGGKKMIAEYEAEGRDALLDAPRQYGLTQQHKHLKEMVHLCALEIAPAFCPIVAPFYAGMEVTVPLFKKDLRGSVADVKALYASLYHSKLVHFAESADEGGFLSAGAFSGRDDMEISVSGNDEQDALVARYDNLGKGASGAAIQNMNILLGVEETTDLVVE